MGDFVVVLIVDSGFLEVEIEAKYRVCSKIWVRLRRWEEEDLVNGV
jgi:hypothetical protein